MLPENAAVKIDQEREHRHALMLDDLLAVRNEGDPYRVSATALRLMVEFPDDDEGYVAFMTAMKSIGQTEMVEAIARKAMLIFTNKVWPWAEAGAAASARGDAEESLRLSAEARERFPDESHGYFHQALILRQLGRIDEASSVAEAAIEHFPHAIWPLLEVGWIEIARGDLAAALAMKDLLQQRFPNESGSHGFSIVALRVNEHLTEAAELALNAIWQFWDQPWPYKEAGLILRMLDRYEEAEIVAWDAMKRFPFDSWPHDELAELKNTLSRDEQSVEFSQTRTDSLHTKFPYFDDAYEKQIDTFIKSHRWSEAEALLQVCGSRLSGRPEICLAWGDLAVLTEDFEAGAVRLGQFRKWFPERLEGLLHLAKVFARLGDAPSADALCLEAMERFPTNPDAFDCYARVALLSGQNQIAANRWREAIKRFPADARLKEGFHDAELANFEQSSVRIKDATTEVNADREDVTKLMLSFQNMGSPTHGCEFGNVQRFFGAEPLGLLRWVAARPESLAQAMSDGFEGFWDEANTRINLGSVPGRPEEREYRLYFSRYDMHVHTFIYLSEVGQEEFIKKYRLRQRLLARKFIEDLEMAESIFVYKQDLLDISDEAIDQLLEAMRQYGKNCVLLFVKQADDENAEGTVKRVHPGLLIGYIDGFIIAPDGNERPIRYDAWLQVCKEAYRIWHESSHSLPDAS